VVYNETDELCFYADFGLLQEAFADPTLVYHSLYQELITEPRRRKLWVTVPPPRPTATPTGPAP
jgi:hypothetical protein